MTIPTLICSRCGEELNPGCLEAGKLTVAPCERCLAEARIHGKQEAAMVPMNPGKAPDRTAPVPLGKTFPKTKSRPIRDDKSPMDGSDWAYSGMSNGND